MSLNQDALNELSTTTGMTEEELRNAAPDRAPVVGEPVRIVTPQAGQQETPLTDEVKAQLLNPQSKLVTLRNGIESTETLGELSKEIADNTAISAADAANIAPHLESFDKVFKPNSFTKHPTRVNYLEVTQYLDQQLKLRKEQVCIQFSALSDSITDAADSFISHRDFLSQELVTSLQAFQSEVAKWKSDPAWLNNQLVHLAGNQYNAANENIPQDALEGELGSFFDKQAFKTYRETLTAFRSVMSKYLTASQLLLVLRESLGVSELISACERAAAYGSSSTPLMLIEALSSPYAVTFLKEFEPYVENSLKRLEEKEKEEGVCHDDYHQALSFVLKNGDLLDEAALSSHYYAETIDIMRRLLPLAQSFLSYFMNEK